MGARHSAGADVRAKSSTLRASRVFLHIDELPPLSEAARHLLALSSVDASRDELANAVAHFQSLHRALLRISGEAAVNATDVDIALRQAVQFAGPGDVRNVLLAESIIAPLRCCGGATYQDPASPIWRHSLAVAISLQALADLVDDVELRREAFVCGLLHDIGKIALAFCAPKSYARVLAMTEGNRVCICDAERDLFGIDHTFVGKRLTENWRIGPVVRDCAWLHHQPLTELPAGACAAKMVRLLSLADSFVRSREFGLSDNGYAGDRRAMADQIGIAWEDAKRSLERSADRWQPTCDLLDLPERPLHEGVKVDSPCLPTAMSSTAPSAYVHRFESQASSSYLKLTERVVRDTSTLNRVTDACAVTARHLREFLVSGIVAVLVADDESQLVHVAADVDSVPVPKKFVLPIGEPIATGRVGAACSTPVRCDLSVLGGSYEAIRRRCGLTVDEEPVWVWSLASGAGVTCEVLFSGGGSSPDRWQAESHAIQAAGTAMGYALLESMKRQKHDHLMDGMLDARRRAAAEQDDRARSRALTMVSEMAAGAAHELNNPLAVISGRAQMGLERCDDPNEKRTLEIITQQAQRASGIIDELIAFAKPSNPRPAPVRLSETIKTLSQRWCEGLPVGSEPFSITIFDPRTVAFTDADHLDTILDAVLANAIDATSSETRRIVINSPSAATDEKVRIEIEDNGVGMSAYVLEHAVDPFYSHRPAGRGRGLGLSRAKRLAEMNGLKLWITSQPKKGTRVTIKLPASVP